MGAPIGARIGQLLSHCSQVWPPSPDSSAPAQPWSLRDPHEQLFSPRNTISILGSNGAPMGGNNLGDVLVILGFFNHMLWYFWGFDYSQMAN